LFAEDEVAQMDRGELKAAATQIEAEKQGVEDARLKPLPDDGEELFRSLEILIIKLQLRKLEVEAEREARKAEAEKEARKAEA